MLYRFIIRPILFLFDPEIAHNLTFLILKYISWFLPSADAYNCNGTHPISIKNLNSANRLGLAAGLDKNGDYINELGKMGFGFIEVGTVTPRAQDGNPRPRLFRLKKNHAIINRMGFNNKGVDRLVDNLKRRKWQGVVGVNIGKNFDTPLEVASEDYLMCLKKVYSCADYIVINISSPNTKDLRQLQNSDPLRDLLSSVKLESEKLKLIANRDVPILVKIAPDLSEEEIKEICKIVIDIGIAGIVATNTTLDRSHLIEEAHIDEKGGLSGEPLFNRSLAVVRLVRESLGDDAIVVGVGGVSSAVKMKKMLDAGADLVQIYSGLIYKGPSIVKDLCTG